MTVDLPHIAFDIQVRSHRRPRREVGRWLAIVLGIAFATVAGGFAAALTVPGAETIVIALVPMVASLAILVAAAIVAIGGER